MQVFRVKTGVLFQGGGGGEGCVPNIVGENVDDKEEARTAVQVHNFDIYSF